MNPFFRLQILSAYVRARRSLRFEKEGDFEKWQDRRVIKHLNSILPKSSWLRERFGDLPVHQWRELPTVGKQEMMQHFDSLNTAGITKSQAFEVASKAEASRDFSPMIGDITVGLSSGSSGGRGVFLASSKERASYAGHALARILHPPLWKGGHRIALFLRASSNLYSSVQSRLVRFAYFDLMQPVESQVAELEKFQPTVLIAPPSVLRMLADLAPQISPHRILSAAETLDVLDAQILAEKFRQPIDQIYQATEGFLGISDQQGVLRLNEDLMVIERDYLDEDKTRFVPIITDFRRTTQPMIRHRLDDVLVLHPTENPNPRTALLRIEGRCDDVLKIEFDSKRHSIFPDFISRALLLADPLLQDFRVHQVGPTQLEVAVKSKTEFEVHVKALQEMIERLVGGNLNLQITPMAFPVNESPSQKRRRIRNLHS